MILQCPLIGHHVGGHQPPKIQKMNSLSITSLEAALAIVEKMEWVASATIWTPTAEEIAEYKADGHQARRQLEVTVYNSHRNATDIRSDIEGLGLECVGDGSSVDGPCYSFVLTA